MATYKFRVVVSDVYVTDVEVEGETEAGAAQAAANLAQTMNTDEMEYQGQNAQAESLEGIAL